MVEEGKKQKNNVERKVDQGVENAQEEEKNIVGNNKKIKTYRKREKEQDVFICNQKYYEKINT